MPKATQEQKAIAGAFCRFLYDLGPNREFALKDLQGALKAVNPGVPGQQTYEVELQVAIRRGFVRAVEGKPNSYLRRAISNAKKGKSPYDWHEFSVVLKDRIIWKLEGRAFQD